jgi:RNA polymerase sigma-70 factor (ECF subfamily)
VRLVSRLSRSRPRLSYEEQRLVEALQSRDERAFTSLLERHSSSMKRIARLYVRSDAVADEVVQETWLAVLEGVDRFEGRSSLRTWIFSILANLAKTRAQREGRALPFSALAHAEGESHAVEPSRFGASGQWASPPRSFGDLPEDRLLAGETLEVVERAIELLPSSQQAVITLRDIEGWSAEEVRNVLDLSETNQRVLLHRARSKVRRALENYFEDGR